MSYHALVSSWRIVPLVGILLVPGLWHPAQLSAAEPLVFRDAGDESGLFPHVAGIAGHGVMWGDVDGNGFPDLYVGTFGGAPYGSKANQFFRNNAGKFTLDDQTVLHVNGRGNGGVFADF